MTKEPTSQQGCLLIVDDDENARTILTATAEGLGYRAQAFESVKSFLDATESDAGLARPLAIMLDVMMPEQDGIEMLRLLAGRQDLDVPIFLMSSSSKDFMAIAAKLGMGWQLRIADSLEKPITAARLRKALDLLQARPDTKGR